MVYKSLECVFLINHGTHQKGNTSRLKPGLARFLNKRKVVKIVGIGNSVASILGHVVVDADYGHLPTIQAITRLTITANANASGRLYENITLLRIYKEINHEYDIALGSTVSVVVSEKILKYGVYTLSFIHRKAVIHTIKLEITAK